MSRTPEQAKIYYQKNKAKYKTSYNKRRKELKLFIIQQKANKKCIYCGETRLPCLAFHHIHKNTKKIEISNMAERGFSKAKILEEIQKCEIVCHNCHAIIHAKDT